MKIKSNKRKMRWKYLLGRYRQRGSPVLQRALEVQNKKVSTFILWTARNHVVFVFLFAVPDKYLGMTNKFLQKHYYYNYYYSYILPSHSQKIDGWIGFRNLLCITIGIIWFPLHWLFLSTVLTTGERKGSLIVENNKDARKYLSLWSGIQEWAQWVVPEMKGVHLSEPKN